LAVEGSVSSGAALIENAAALGKGVKNLFQWERLRLSPHGCEGVVERCVAGCQAPEAPPAPSGTPSAAPSGSAPPPAAGDKGKGGKDDKTGKEKKPPAPGAKPPAAGTKATP